MKKLIIVMMFILCASMVSAYCNETQQYNYINGNNSFGVDNITTSKVCSGEQESNNSFLITGLIFMFITALIALGVYLAKTVWLRTVLSLGASIMVMLLVRLSMFFVTLSNPSNTALFDLLVVFYTFSLWAFRFILIASIFILIVIILNVLTGKYKKEKKGDWERWGVDK